MTPPPTCLVMLLWRPAFESQQVSCCHPKRLQQSAVVLASPTIWQGRHSSIDCWAQGASPLWQRVFPAGQAAELEPPRNVASRGSPRDSEGFTCSACMKLNPDRQQTAWLKPSVILQLS